MCLFSITYEVFIMDFITDRLYPLLSEFTHASLEVIKNQDQSISYWIVHRNDIYCVGDERKLLFCRLVAATKNREEYIDINVSNDVSLVSNKLSALEFLSLPDSDLRIMIINKFRISFSNYHFGCCHLYTECYKANRCLHTDLAYSTVCDYRKLIESGQAVPLR